MTTLSRGILIFSGLVGLCVGFALAYILIRDWTPAHTNQALGATWVLLGVLVAGIVSLLSLAIYRHEDARHAPQGKPWVIQAGGQAQLPPPREYPRVEVVDDWMEVE